MFSDIVYYRCMESTITGGTVSDITYDRRRVTSSQIKTILLLEGDFGATGDIVTVYLDGVVELRFASGLVYEVEPAGGWHPAGPAPTPALVFP